MTDVRTSEGAPIDSDFDSGFGTPIVVDVTNEIAYAMNSSNAQFRIGGSDVTSGTYTPTLTNTTNITASTAYVCQYLRVVNVVTVSGQVDIDTAGAGAAELGMSIPVASDFAATRQCGGTATTITGTHNSAGIAADATNNRVSFKWDASGAGGSRAWHFSFTYLIV